jgi:hypothetical protein
MDLMNSSDLEKAVEFVKKNYKGCPNCGALGVDIHNIVGLPLLKRQTPSGFALGQQSIPALPLICDNCGFITLFAAKDIIQEE